MVTITDHEMARRKLVARMQSRITEVIGEFVSDDPGGITYTECLKVLMEAAGRLVGQMVVDEWREKP